MAESESSAPVVCVFGASGPRPGDPEYELGVRCGAAVARAGLTVATGGYGGLMEAVSRGAAVEGGHVLGITAPAVFRDRSSANPYVAEELRALSLPSRVANIIDASDAAIALPGSIGTLAELLVAWNTAFVARFSGVRPIPVVTVGAQWAALIPHLSTLLDTDGTLVKAASDVDHAVALVCEALDGQAPE